MGGAISPHHGVDGGQAGRRVLLVPSHGLWGGGERERES